MSVSEPILGKITEFVSATAKHPKAARFFLMSVAQSLLPEERIRVCHRVVVPMRTSVDVVHDSVRKSARYCGLMKCGLAWICPLCNVRLAEQRRMILDTAFQNARGVYVPFMATYTVQHDCSMKLADLIEKLCQAYRSVRRHRQWHVTKEEWSIFGEIRAMEITYSFLNGWHVHFHVLMIVAKAAVEDDKSFISSLENQMFIYWYEALGKYGLKCSREHGVRVEAADFANRYVAKFGDWSISKELTRGASKTIRALESCTIFDLLLLHFAGMDVAGRRFVEYFHATKKRSSLQWTPGLKARLGVSSIHENANAEEQPLSDQERVLITLSLDQWTAVLAAGGAGHLLDLAARGDYEIVAGFVAGLSTKNMIDV